ncbi:MAG TPA: hypothetical protein VHY09_08915 [Candidatus Methylacidiphilales bacterium]|nr:hypothetical protein [Candidatus Methylacidiphilales bacterium]
MRFPAALGLLFLLVTASQALAQIQVGAQMGREGADYLLYERTDMLVTLTNTSDTDIVLDNDGSHPWLSFMVCKHDTLPVRPERQALFKPLSLKQGETKTLRINLTPLFSFREEGAYTAQAVVTLPGAGDLVSREVPFTVLRGKVVWSEQRPVAGADRTYSLLRFSPKPDETELYLRVEVPSDNVVLANVGLGPVEAFIDPQVFFDPQGNLHVLHLISMSTYLYTRANQDGKIEHQGVFKTFLSIPPRLRKMDDGNVYVAGGLEETPDMAHESLLAGQKGVQPSGAQAPAPEPPPSTVSSSPADANTPVVLPGQTAVVPPPDAGLRAQAESHQ